MIVVYYVQMSCRWYVMARKTVDVSVESIVVVAVVKSNSDVNKADVTSQKGDFDKFTTKHTPSNRHQIFPISVPSTKIHQD